MEALMCRLMDNLCCSQLLICPLNHISNAKHRIAAEMKSKSYDSLIPHNLDNFHKFFGKLGEAVGVVDG